MLEHEEESYELPLDLDEVSILDETPYEKLYMDNASFLLEVKEMDSRFEGNHLPSYHVLLKEYQHVKETSGREISAEEAVARVLKRESNVRNFLYVQERAGHCVVCGIPNPYYQDDEEEDFLTIDSVCEACGVLAVFSEFGQNYEMTLDEFKWALSPAELLDDDLVESVSAHQLQVFTCYKELMAGNDSPSLRKTMDELLATCYTTKETKERPQ